MHPRKLLALAASILVAAPFAAAQSCLNTINPFAPNNGGSVNGAVYFDVTVAASVLLTGLTTNYSIAAGTAVGMDVYITPGTSVGVQNQIALWTLAGTDNGTSVSAGDLNPTSITLASPILLSPGSYGMCLVARGSAHRYTNGTGANQTFSDAFLTINLGSALNVPFTGTALTPRVWNGSLCYTPAAGLYPNFSATPRSGPLGTNVAFTDTTYTSDPGGVVAWIWDFENDGTPDSNLQNPTHTYNAEGNYTVSLTVFDSTHPQGNITKTNYIGIDLVDASFTATVVSGTTIQFNDTSTGGPTSWAWDFDNDGTVDSTVQNPTHTYPVAGAYNCRLTVTDAVSNDSTVVNLGVGIIPVPSFGSTFTSATLTRGFYFQAPTRFSIVSALVPDESNHGLQNVAIYRLPSAPPAFSATINGQLEFYQTAAPSGTPVPCAVSFDTGEWVGVLGACGDATTMRSSYATPAGPYASSVLGVPTTLNRMLTQTNMVVTGGAGALSSENAAALGRVICGVSACTAIAYGAGSPSGAGPAAPTLRAGTVPCLGTAAQLVVNNQDNSAIGFLALGLGRTSLPSPFGTILVNNIGGTELMLGGAPLAIGDNTHVFNVPNIPALNGTGPYNWQEASLLVLTGQVALSNGLEWYLAL